MIGSVNQPPVGNLQSLTTTEKSTAVAAINELAARPAPNIVFDALNTDLDFNDEWGDKIHWYGSIANVSIVTDVANPFAGRTMRIGIGSTIGGKICYFSETGLRVGDTVTFKALIFAAAGSYVLATRQVDAAGTFVGAQVGGTTTSPAGVATLISVTITLSEATAVGVYLYIVRASGTSIVDVYAMWGGVGSVADTPTVGIAPYSTTIAMDAAAVAARQALNIVWDSFNADLAVGDEWGGGNHWQSASNLSLIDPDAANPYSGRTLRVSSTLGGKRIYFDESGLLANDVVTFRAKVYSAAGTYQLSARPIDAAGTLIGTQANGASHVFSGDTYTLEVSITLSVALTAGVSVYLVRSAGSGTANIYAMWGGLGDIGDVPSLGPNVYAGSNAVTLPAFPTATSEYGRHYLKYWQLALAQVQEAVSGAVATVAFIGDSWVQNERIGAPLRTWLQAQYGNAGPGYVGIGNSHGAPTVAGMTFTRTGTWTDSDQVAGSRGVDIAHADTTDISTPGKVVIVGVFTDADIHYMAQVDGGSFRWRIDAGSWSTVSTAAGAEAHAVEAITGLSNASHTLTIECTVAGTAGIRMLGVDCKINANGVRLHRVGNGGATGIDYTDVDATIWQASLTQLNPDLSIILLGTNDHNLEYAPSAFAVTIDTMIDRIRAAVPTCDVLLLTPALNGLSKAYSLSQYVDELRDMAVADSCAALDAYMHVLAYASDGVGGWENSTHLDARGGRIVANLLMRMLRAD